MIHRVISLGSWPLRVLQHIDHTRCVSRAQGTAYRGSIALVGCERIWAVGVMSDCKPVVVKGPKIVGYLWYFTELALLPRDFQFDCGRYDRNLWESPNGPEPQGLNAGAQALLSDYLDACEQLRQNGIEARGIARSAPTRAVVVSELEPVVTLALCELMQRAGRDATNMPDEVAFTVCESGKRKGQLGMVF